MLSTVVTVPGGLGAGRAIWASDDERLVYFAAGTAIKKWTPTGGLADYATNFVGIGNMTMDPSGHLVVADRGDNSVWRMTDGGSDRVRIAGNGSATGTPVDGDLATNSPVDEARGVCCLPTGGVIVGCHHGNDIFYVDPAGRIYMLLNGGKDIVDHHGDGTWFYNTAEKRVSQIRAVTVDWEGNLLITENDAGYVRKVQFLPYVP
jgi:hypothetical protein